MALNLKNSSTALCSIYFLIILCTGYLFSPAIMEHLARSTEVYANSCQLKNTTKGIKATCSHLGLTLIPPDLPLNTITLDASYNQIRVLQNQSFENLRQLISLSVRGNLISDLEGGTFLPLTNLRTLDMEHNKLTHLQQDVFDSNHLLSTLILSTNNFSSVPTDALSTIPQLQSISLSYNLIQKADFAAFSHSSQIPYIDLGNNAISAIEISDFKPLQNHSLQYLSMAKNKLHSLPTRVFSYLNRVGMLKLDFNRLYDFHLSSFLGHMNISMLSVYGCGIKNIVQLDNSSLSKGNFPVIDSLEMSRNIIAYIPSQAFQGLNQTSTLKIQGNKITTIFADSFCGLGSLTHLDLSDNRIKSLYIGMFSCNSHLQELILSRNEISRLCLWSFKGLTTLRTLDLSNNQLKRFDTRQRWANPKLQRLDISHNEFYTLRPNLFSGDLSNLQILDISFNKISVYSNHTFNNLSSLQELYLISEQKQYLNQVFSHMKKLKKLDISYTETFWTSLHQFKHTISLEELRMSYNYLDHTKLYDNATQSSLFEGLISLKRLNLRGNNLQGLEPGVFSPLTNLLSLDLSLSDIVQIKSGLFKGLMSLRILHLGENKIVTTIAGIFSGLNNLEFLYFQNGKLQYLDKNMFVKTPYLRRLYLSHNLITNVQKETFFSTNHTLVIDISNNPFSCDCELKWFITWLRNSNTELKNPNKTQCYNTSFKAVVGKPILMFVPADFCGINILLITGTSLLSFFVVLSVIIAYIKRWWLNHKLFLLKLAIVGYEEMEEDFNAGNYEFHLNLMFHEAEQEWVNQVIKPALEERMPHLQNIIYGDEDLHLGMYYIEALYDAIENSFKTVLLISNESIGDAWFMTKLRMALEHINETGLDKVILIFLEDIHDDRLPYLVRLFLSRNKPYMLWTEDEDGQELFWAQFEKSMRANRAINNAIPL